MFPRSHLAAPALYFCGSAYSLTPGNEFYANRQWRDSICADVGALVRARREASKLFDLLGVSGRYVNTVGHLAGYTGCQGGNIMPAKLGMMFY
ncbi:MAG: hypothetical protein H7061_01090 [Bdellovibrionaceae bacterium]|nr:hypothetical protein [Bdellovibrio sp.]